ncbi:MAG: hypothetical protein QOE76_3056 [Frankiales bacterium]|nr:hypothetical protein [Frankiales bacterium]
MTTSTQVQQPVHHPAVQHQLEKHASDAQLRVAGWITAFAGSMMFVYVHIVIFAVWMILVEQNPWPKLTLVVSLEAIFLSTFVMIGQNRQSAFQQAKADHDFVAQELELNTNTELTKKIHELTVQLHAKMCVPSEIESWPADGSGQRKRRAAGDGTGHARQLLDRPEGRAAVPVEGDDEVVGTGHGVGEGHARQHHDRLGDLHRTTDVGLHQHIGPCHRSPS